MLPAGNAMSVPVMGAVLYATLLSTVDWVPLTSPVVDVEDADDEPSQPSSVLDDLIARP
jgi:hypothetical protein